MTHACLPKSLTSMGLLWRCYTMEMASFRLTQMTPSTPDQPIRGDLIHHTISANHKEWHPLTQLIRVEPHKYDPFSKSCQNDIKFGKSQNSIQIPFKACLRIHCLSDETHTNRAEQLVIVTMTKDFHNDIAFFFVSSKWTSGMDEIFQGSRKCVSVSDSSGIRMIIRSVYMR